MTQSVLTIATAVRDRDSRNDLTTMVRNMDGITEATRQSGASILIFEVERGKEKEFLDMRTALMDQVSGEVFLVCAKPSPKFLIMAMRAGIHEVLPLPITRQDLSRALARYRDRAAMSVPTPEAPGTGRIIGVVGARPGVGATTLAVNLAVQLQRTTPTALMDLCVPLGEAPLFLDMEYSYTWGDVARHVSRLDPTYLHGVMPRHASGLSLLASPGDGVVAQEAEQAMAPILEQMRKSFSATVLDTDAILSPTGLKELEKADEIILVINLTLPCLAHAQRLSDTLRTLEANGSRVRVVASRYHKQSDISPVEASEVLERKIEWLIPEDGTSALSALNQGLTLAEAAPKSPATKAIHEIGHSLAGSTSTNGKNTARKGLASLFSRKKNVGINIQGAEAV